MAQACVCAPLAGDAGYQATMPPHSQQIDPFGGSSILGYSDILSNSSGKLAKTMATRLASSDVSSLNCRASASLSRE
jgi:hypothetical protein